MALREKLAERSQPFLEPGEQVQEVFQAQSGMSPYWYFLVTLLAFLNKYYVVAVTDRAIVVMEAGKGTGTHPKVLVRRLPRETRIGEMSGLWGKSESLGGDKPLYIHRRFHQDVARADGAIQAPPPPAAPQA